MLNYDVVIAGYGPTGATAANLLATSGLKVLVVDPSLEIFDIPRAVHFDGETMRTLQELGLADKIEPRTRKTPGLRFVDSRNRILMEQRLGEMERPNFWANTMMFHQPRIEAVLRESVKRFENVEIRLGWSLIDLTQQDDGVIAHIQQVEGGARESVQCHYLLAADGASSPIRQILGIELEDLGCDEPWLVVDWIIDENVEVEGWAYQLCDPARPGTLVPCEANHVRWEFMLNEDDQASVIEDEAAVRAMMSPHVYRLSPMLDAQQGELPRAKIYNFHALVARTFQQDRVFLLGDAAHQTPPFMGQGMCAGIRDAYNLIWKLAGVMLGEFPATLLDTYSSERRPHAYTVVSAAIAQGRVIQARNPFKTFMRDSFFRLASLFPSLLNHLNFLGDWRLGEGLLAIDGAPTADTQLGKQLPQSKLVTVDGSEALSDDLLGSGFTLVGFGVDPAVHLQVDYSIAGTGLSLLQVGGEGGMHEIEGTLCSWARLNNISLAIVRPDLQIYGVCLENDDPKQQLEGLLSRLRQQLTCPYQKPRTH